MSAARLLAIDLQPVFATGPWATPGFDRVVEQTRRLAQVHEPVFTRFLAPAEPAGSWVEYYDRWAFARQPADADAYALSAPFTGSPTVDATTFGKWPALAAALDPRPGERFLAAGVTTDCCVLATVLAAADAGMYVQVVEDACAGADADTHRAAIDTLRLFTPQVEIVTVDDVVPAR